LSPSAKIVSGFKPIMPVFQGLVGEEQLTALVAYVKSLSPAPSGATAGVRLTPTGTRSQNPKE
jgi:cytochrome c oxidase subunit II